MNKQIGETMAIALVKIMKKKSFKNNLYSHKYLIFMPCGSMLFMNDVSFYDGALSIIETQELKDAIETGRIGHLIKRKSSYEFDTGSKRKVKNDSVRI